MNVKYSLKQINSKIGKVNSIYNKFILNPLAKRIVYILSNFTSIKPFVITITGTIISFLSAFLFFRGELVMGAILFQLTEILDGCDGLLARTRGEQSVFGTLLDYYTDVLRLSINVLGITIYLLKYNETHAIIVILLFLSLNFAESFIDISYLRIRAILENKKDISFSKIEKLILKVKKYLEGKGFKLNLLHYHERIFFVLFLGPLTRKIYLFGVIGIILVLYSIHLKFVLDIAIIKDHIINKERLYIRTISEEK